MRLRNLGHWLRLWEFEESWANGPQPTPLPSGDILRHVHSIVSKYPTFQIPLDNPDALELEMGTTSLSDLITRLEYPKNHAVRTVGRASRHSSIDWFELTEGPDVDLTTLSLALDSVIESYSDGPEHAHGHLDRAYANLVPDMLQLTRYLKLTL